MKKLTALFIALVFIFCLSFSFGCKNKESENITTYQIDCNLKDNVLEGRESVAFYNSTENAFTELKFNLFGNAFRQDAKYKPIRENLYYKAYPDGVNYGNISINGV